MIRSLIFLIFFVNAYIEFTVGQQLNPSNLIGGDTCIFDNPCEFIRIDTTQPNNLWQVGIPSKAVFNAARVGTRALITDSINVYDTNSISSFTILLDHTNSITYELVFWHRYDTDEGHDGGYIELSYDMGKTWFDILDWGRCPLTWCPDAGFRNLYNQSDILSNGDHGFSGSSNGWQKSSFYCTRTFYNTIVKDNEEYLSKRDIQNEIISDTTLARFTFVSDSIQDNKAGWCIDNMMLHLHYDPTGLHSNNISKKISLYPNPAYDSFTYYSEIPISCIYLYNSLGTILGRYDKPDNTLKIDALPKGLYYAIFFRDNEVISVEKLLITL